ncbi:hypothetical protein FRC01_004831, partial [Tulasnella sp. 417]
ARPTAGQLLTLPFELHEHISLFLPSGSIPNLIKSNRLLRLIYEQILYQSISLYHQPLRSTSLFKTFTLHPDLALLVRTLDIDLRPCRVGISSQTRTISPFRVTGLDLARNVTSLGISGKCLFWGQHMNAIHELISKLRLTSLRIRQWQPEDVQRPSHEVVFANFRTILQGQPMLQDLMLESCGLERSLWVSVGILPGRDPMEVGPLGIEATDIPSLRILRADAATVASILPALRGDKLESLEMYTRRHSSERMSRLLSCFSDMKEARQQIRTLNLPVRSDSLQKGWRFDFGNMLELFPNLKSLKIIGSSGASLVYFPQILDEYIEKIISQITRSPGLTTLEASLTSQFDEQKYCVIDVKEELMVQLKRSCPALQTFIDPGMREWRFLPSVEQGQNDVFRVVKVGRLHWSSTHFRGWDTQEFRSYDLQTLEWDVLTSAGTHLPTSTVQQAHRIDDGLFS